MKHLMLKLYWAATRNYLRFRGAVVGRHVKCNGFPYIKIRKGGRLIIGDHVMINATRWSNAHVVSGSTTIYVDANACVEIGEGAGVSGSRIIAYKRIEIGRRTLVGAGCLVCDSDMHEVPLGNPSGTAISPISIGNKVFLGAGVTVLKGVSIGDGAVVGSGSVITHNINASTLVTGTPARNIRQLNNNSDLAQ